MSGLLRLNWSLIQLLGMRASQKRLAVRIQILDSKTYNQQEKTKMIWGMKFFRTGINKTGYFETII